MKSPRLLISLFVCIACVLPSLCARAEQELTDEQRAFFENKVRPLLVANCYECHSAEAKEVKGGLRLDSKHGWEKGGDSGTAIEPGNVAGSLLLTAIRYEDFEMPPKGKLTDDKIAIFEQWVKMGAPDPRVETPTAPATQRNVIDFDKAREFWAFQPPKFHPAPKVSDEAWPLDDIDRFVLACLDDAGLKPAPDADPRTWLRRVTFDLIGLPPTPKEIDDFLADESSEAHEKVVDRLLASRQFGEHWGRHWLDVARYADSNGSDFNATYFNAWRYRNYIIDAFNHDKPFDQLVREQVAGDLLPFDNDQQRADQIVATGFVMFGAKMLSERDKEKLLMDVADEQIDTVGRALMGLTLGCARCHDHKFDPIPTADYYALAGIFRSTEPLYGESQQYVSTWREWELPMSPDLAAAVAAHEEKRNAANAELDDAKKELKAAQDQLAQFGKAPPLGILVDDTEAKLVGQWKPSTYSPNYVGKGYIHDDNADKGAKSVTFTPELPEAGDYEVRVSFAASNGRATNVPVTIHHADGEETIEVNEETKPPIDGLFKPLGRFRFEAGTAGSVVISNAGTAGHVIADAAQFIPVEQFEAKNEPAAKKKEDDPERLKLTAQVETAAQQVKKLEEQLKQLDKDAPKVPKAMGVREAEKIADCQICIRGDHKNRGDAVPRGFLRVLTDSPAYVTNREQSGRFELADWLASAENPLTARVIVNRIWSHLIGEGLVRTVDNFGHLGGRPTHPELLDRLAVDFVSDGWSMKKLIRRIALSRIYRASSRFDEGSFAADAENRLLWQAHRKRLPAESIRDAMLAISGQLDPSQGGSPVEGLGTLVTDNSANSSANFDYDNNRRRSVYLPIIRNELPEILTVFDFANPDMVCGRRATTNVPAQALLLLNSPFVRQAAEKTAERLLADESLADEQRIDHAYALIVARQADDAERQRALEYVQSAGDDRKQNWTRLVQALFASTEFRMLN